MPDGPGMKSSLSMRQLELDQSSFPWIASVVIYESTYDLTWTILPSEFHLVAQTTISSTTRPRIQGCQAMPVRNKRDGAIPFLHFPSTRVSCTDHALSQPPTMFTREKFALPSKVSRSRRTPLPMKRVRLL